MRTIIRLTLIATLFVIAANALAQSGPYSYYPLTPCRIVDTRNPNGVNGGPVFGTATTRSFQIRGTCGVPAGAKAVSLNVTITQATQPSFLTIWPSNVSKPVVSMINFEPADPALANGIIVGVSTNTQDLSVYNDFGNVHVIIDVTGYFQ
jgi:hypothetical protein